MLRLIPKPLHIAALRTVHALRLRWWRLMGTRVTGCRVVALDARCRVLLIRHSYGVSHWMLPGGGMKRGEDPVVAGARELFEETAVRITGAAKIGMIADTLHGSVNDVHVIAGWTRDTPVADGREIVEAAFFALDALPADISRRLPDLLPGYVIAAKAARRGE